MGDSLENFCGYGDTNEITITNLVNLIERLGYYVTLINSRN